MASSSASVFLSPNVVNHRELTSLNSAGVLYSPKSRKTSLPRCAFIARNSSNRIPKQFRPEHLKEGLMENYKNVPRSLYGLTPSQMAVFMPDDKTGGQQEKEVTEDTISAKYWYLKHSGMKNVHNIEGGNRYENLGAKASGGISMRGGGRRGGGRRTPPPDLPSILFDNRIIYLGLPLVPEVTELILAQFLWLDFIGEEKPIYLYLNCTGTQDTYGNTVGKESDAYVIADAMHLCKQDVYTVNIGAAWGQAGMLLSLGKKGKRAIQPYAQTALYLPTAPRTNGQVSDMWIQARELDVMTSHYLEFLSRGTGKSEEELEKDLEHGQFFQPQEAIDYGIADVIVYSTTENYTKPPEHRTPEYVERLRRAKERNALARR